MLHRKFSIPLKHIADEIEVNNKHLPTTDCADTVDKRSKTIISPNFPNDYRNNSKCEWTINAPPGRRIKLHFEHFKTEDCHDGISIYEGNSYSSSYWWTPKEIRKEMCGDTVPPDVESNNNTIFIHWSADERVSNMGFRLKYSII